MIPLDLPKPSPAAIGWQQWRIDRDKRPRATLTDISDLVLRPEVARYPDNYCVPMGDVIRQAITEHDGEGLRGNLIKWCKRCSMPSAGVWLTLVQSNGIRVAQLRCIRCTGLSMARAERKIYPNLDGPVVDDRLEDDLDCERCGADGAHGLELHHWAPRHLFHDAWSWPMSYLCVACHREWHQRIKDHHR